MNFRVIIAGGRDFCNKELLFQKADLLLKEQIKKGNQIIIISGGAKGADKLGEVYAKDRRFTAEIYPADWEKFGKSAGYKRNVQMADIANALIAFWDGESKGTKHMIDIAKKKNLAVRVVNY
jgi:hypothetical protein